MTEAVPQSPVATSAEVSVDVGTAGKRNFVWSEVPDPLRREGEVLIEVYAAAVNRADLMQKDGCCASPADWPQWCGLEVSGVVLEAPMDAAVKPGDRVCALLGGGYSQRVAVPAGMVVPIPEGFSMIEAASLPEVWCTIYLNLILEARGMKKGDVFYVQAGASGVGLAAIQYARQMGAEVITTVDSAEKRRSSGNSVRIMCLTTARKTS